LEDCPPLDVLVVPGGWGTRREIHNERLIAWIAGRGPQVETLASVCTGSMLLGQAGLLDGRRATTHWKALDWMRESFPAITIWIYTGPLGGRSRSSVFGTKTCTEFTGHV
jgi:transcriptional regulator GlxA family with amidase domain